MDAFPPLQTDRLMLRLFEESDIPELVQLAGDRDIAATTLRLPHPYSEAHARNWVEETNRRFRENESLELAVTRKSDGLLLGAAGLVFNHEFDNAELGYCIGKPFWGNGYAGEAAQALVLHGFDQLNLYRIHAHHFAGNKASGKVLENCGMVREGVLIQHIKKWGRYHDIILYGMLNPQTAS